MTDMKTHTQSVKQTYKYSDENNIFVWKLTSRDPWEKYNLILRVKRRFGNLLKMSAKVSVFSDFIF